MNILNTIRESMGMDANNFYPMLIAFVPFLWNIVTKFRERRKSQLLELYCKREGDAFYGWVITIEIIGLIIGIVVAYVLVVCVQIGVWLFAKVNLSVNVVYALYVVFRVGLFGVLISLLSRVYFIRKRVLGDRKGRFLIYFQMILLHVYDLIEIMKSIELFELHMVITAIVYIAITIIEIMGLVHFRSRYTKYEYSKLVLYIEGGEKIECSNIENVYRKSDVLVINEKRKPIRIKYDSISRVEYLGEEKVILHTSWLM